MTFYCGQHKALSTRTKMIIFFSVFPWYRFKNICVHTDSLKTTQKAVVHIPGLLAELEIHQKRRRREGACALSRLAVNRQRVDGETKHKKKTEMASGGNQNHLCGPIMRSNCCCNSHSTTRQVSCKKHQHKHVARHCCCCCYETLRCSQVEG